MNLLDRAKELEKEMIENRRYLHTVPELGLDLPVTTKYVKERLIEMGYNPKEICKSGIVATVGKECGKVIMLRADMDALPMAEESGLDFSSKSECAHTCGHDLHTSILLGAAKILKENEDKLNGMVKLMFQPGEEPVIGAKAMIEAGLLDNPKVDAAIAMHINAGELATGVVGYTIGETFAAADKFAITVKGVGSHGAQPHKSVDPINVAVHIYLSLQELLAREVNPIESAVVSVGMFNAGIAENVIPNDAVMKGSIRCYSNEVREHLKKRIVEIADFTAKAFGARAEVDFFIGVPAIISDEKFTNEMIGYIKEVVGDNIVPYKKQMISEDFSYVSELVPSSYLALGAGSKEEGYEYGLHSPKVLFNEEAMKVGAAVFANCAIRYLENN